ncbi:hypothetical protein EYV94_08185 [Puteibacter caeruleilacunae]|nr:hypothetical protein EYV94_08185 [Puteibacter caeruleilacunae]
MISQIKRDLNRNLSNIPGWRTKRRIVVIESDDWGSIRMSSQASFNRLKDAGIHVDKDHYNANDGLESNKDMEMLMELLQQHHDSTGRHPVITGVNVVANPDFEKIEANGFSKYEYESYIDTCSRYPNHDRVYELWKQAQKERLMVPVFHGREHLNAQRWLRGLQAGCESTRLAFDCGVTGIPNGINGAQIGDYQAAFDIDTLEDVAYQKEVLTSGLDLFEKLYGHRAKFFIPTNGPFNNQLEPIAKQSGIDYLGTGKIQLEPQGNGQYKKHFRYLGKKSADGIMYLTRNAFFEPNSWEYSLSKDWVNDCLHEIELAFRWHKPATISSHRTNYIGWLNEDNRSNGLTKLNELLSAIIKKWPNVEFMTSSELGDLISTTKK